MAKVIITIEDGEDQTHISMECDPVFNNSDGTPNTTAQEYGLAIIASLADLAKEEGMLNRAVAIQDDGTEVKL